MKENIKNLTVKHNEKLQRFEAEVEGEEAFVEYEHAKEGSIVFTHTIVPPPLEGRGVGSELAHAALEYARLQHLKIVPQCSFINAYVRRHSKYQSLVDGGRA
ncbi:MAG: N-acetyltransferase [Pyrinomonadaceae bacterium]|nr:N-acetyltransferase [Pyrinomonadaceae bacterium]